MGALDNLIKTGTIDGGIPSPTPAAPKTGGFSALDSLIHTGKVQGTSTLPLTPPKAPAPAQSPTPSIKTGIPAANFKSPTTLTKPYTDPFYGPSNNLDSASGKPLLTFHNEAAMQDQLLKDRVYPGFDPTKPQKIDHSNLTNGRLSLPSSTKIKKDMGGTTADELDHAIALELSGSNDRSNLIIEPGRKGGLAAAHDKIENQIARDVINGDKTGVSLAEGQRRLAEAKGRTLTEDSSPRGIAPRSPAGPKTAVTVGQHTDSFLQDEIGATVLQKYPGTVSSLASLQEDPFGFAHKDKPYLSRLYSSTVGTIKQALADEKDRVERAITNSDHSEGAVASGALDILSGAAGIVFSPISAAFGAAKETPILKPIGEALSLPFQAVGEALSALVTQTMQRLPISQDNKDRWTKPVAEVAALVAQIALGEASAKAGLAPGEIDRLLKETQTTYSLPRTVHLSGRDVYDIYAGLETGEKSRMVARLGLSSDQIKSARRNGISIEAPVDKIVRVADRPYWAKIKEAVGVKPEENITVDAQGSPKQTVRGYIEAPKSALEGAPAEAPSALLGAPGATQEGIAGGTPAASEHPALDALIAKKEAPTEMPPATRAETFRGSGEMQEKNIKGVDNGTGNKSAKLELPQGEVQIPVAVKALRAAGYTTDEVKQIMVPLHVDATGQLTPAISSQAILDRAQALESGKLKDENPAKEPGNNPAVAASESGKAPLPSPTATTPPLENKGEIATPKAGEGSGAPFTAKEQTAWNSGTHFPLDFNKEHASMVENFTAQATEKLGGKLTPEAEKIVAKYKKEAEQYLRAKGEQLLKAPSPSVTGGANYPVARAARARAIYEGKAGKFSEFERSAERKISIIARDKEQLRTSKLSDADRLREHIQSLKKSIARLHPKRDEFFIEKGNKQIAGAEKRLAKLESGNPAIKNDPAKESGKDTITEIKRQTERRIAVPKEIEAKTADLRKSFSAVEDINSILHDIVTELEVSEPGYRFSTPIPEDVPGDREFYAVPSTFPSWLPERLRSTELFGKVIAGLRAAGGIEYPTDPRAVKQRELYDEILNRIDRAAGIDTSATRKAIMNLYEEKSNLGNPAGKTAPKAEADRSDGRAQEIGRGRQKELIPKLGGRIAEAIQVRDGESNYYGENKGRRDILRDRGGARDGSDIIGTANGERALTDGRVAGGAGRIRGGNRSISERGAQISPVSLRFRKEGFVSFPNEKISSPADVAFAFKNLRQNATESFYVVGLKGDKPVSIELVSMGDISSSKVNPYEISPALSHVGADGAYLVHNHPSGVVEPSADDIKTTLRIKTSLADLGIDLKGHVIIDTTEYGNVTAAGEASTVPLPKELWTDGNSVPKFEKYIEWKGDKSAATIKNGQEAVEIMKGAVNNWDQNSMVIYTDSRDQVRMIDVVPKDKFDVADIVKKATGGRATNIILGNTDHSATGLMAIRDLSRTLADNHGINLQDSIAFSGEYPTGWQSARAEGNLEKPESGQYLSVRDSALEEEKKPARFDPLKDSNFVKDIYKKLKGKLKGEDELAAFIKQIKTDSAPEGITANAKSLWKDIKAALNPTIYQDKNVERAFDQMQEHYLRGAMMAELETRKLAIPEEDGLKSILNYEAGIKDGYTEGIQENFDRLFRESNERGIHVRFLPNYIEHVYQESPQEVMKKIAEYMLQQGTAGDIVKGYLEGVKDLPEPQAKALGLNPRFTKSRTMPTYKMAMEKLNLTPMYTNPGQILGHYRENLERAIANRNFLTDLMYHEMIDGTPLSPEHSAWMPLTASFSPKGYYAPPKLARWANQYFNDGRYLSIPEKIARIGHIANRAASDIILSGGPVIPRIARDAEGRPIPGVRGTDINAFSAGIVWRELMGANFKVFSHLVRANFDGASLDYFEQNLPILKMMAEEGIDMRRRGDTYRELFTNLVSDKRLNSWKAFGSGWDKVFGERTFKFFMPQLEIQIFKDAYGRFLAQGMKPLEAQQLAGDVLRNGTGATKNTGRSQFVQDVLGSSLFAPRYRESLINFFVNTAKSAYPGNWSDPTYYRNRRFIIGSVIAFAVFQAINKARNGNFTWDNPPGHEFDIRVVHKDGSITYIPYGPSIMAVPRNIIGGTINLGRGNFPDAIRQFGSAFAQVPKLIFEFVANQDYYGREIYKPTDTGLQAARKVAAHFALGTITHPYLAALWRSTHGTPIPQAISNAMEIPLKFSSLDKEKKSALYDAQRAADTQRARDKERLTPIYENIKQLVQEGDTENAQRIVNGLSPDDYAIYKSLLAVDTRTQTTKTKADMLTLAQHVRDLVSSGKRDEAQSILDSLTDKEYTAYTKADSLLQKSKK